MCEGDNRKLMPRTSGPLHTRVENMRVGEVEVPDLDLEPVDDRATPVKPAAVLLSQVVRLAVRGEPATHIPGNIYTTT